jgi:isochorismate synthase
MHQATLDIDHKLSETDHLRYLSDVTFSLGFSLALWRLPANSEKHMIVSRKPLTLTVKKALEDLSAGFLFAPFDKNESSIFLPADFVFNFTEGKLKEPATHKETSSFVWMNEARQQKNKILKGI